MEVEIWIFENEIDGFLKWVRDVVDLDLWGREEIRRVGRRSCGRLRRRRVDGDVVIVLIEYLYGVDDDGDVDEGLEEIEDFEDWSEGEMVVVVLYF